jgi:Na+/melibiose symporter-like transporter
LVFSLKQCGVPLGAMVVAASAPIIAGFAGWRAGALTMAVLALVVAFAMQPLRAALDGERDPTAGRTGPRAILREAGASLAMLRQDAALMRLTVMASAYGITQFCFSTFFVAFQVTGLGVPLAEAGLRLAIAQAGGVAGRIGWALLADRFGARPVLVTCGLGTLVATLALAGAGMGWPGFLVLGAGLLMGVTAVGWNGVMLAEAARLAPPGQVGAATSALSFCFGATMLVAPPLFSALIGLTGGYAAGFLMCAAAAVVGAVAIAGARRPRAQE